MRYALLKYSTSNLGDQIQSIAAARFLPRVDELIDRDHLDEYGNVKSLEASQSMLICNGWWTHRPTTWPPPPSIHPLLISMHIHEDEEVLRHFTSPMLRHFYEKHGPVGCRDTRTLELLEKQRIPAYFSGCLSLTLSRCDVPRNGRVFFVDVFGPDAQGHVRASAGDAWWTAIPESIRRMSTHVTHRMAKVYSHAERQKRARALLELYRNAHLVITGRLHCALPCVAMGTPVVMVIPDGGMTRLSGMEHLLTVCTRSDLISGRLDIDWTTPPEPSSCEAIRSLLVEKCARFIQAAPGETPI
ncbi:polysaccharide pyruvyl transferase family protein [Planctomycetales bacterium ZRK34]|nr:polysaccharide pyruvyl transferase family protein [Planctomycetales bacterium ZRK34]